MQAALRALTIVLFLVAAWPAAGEQWRLRLYGVEDGLPSSEIHDIQQDADGRLWLATRGGIANYDGLSWRNFGMAEGLSWADMAELRFTADGRLFCISERQPYHIFKADRGHFELVAVNDAPPRSAELTGFEILPSARDDETPRVVMGTRDDGLFLLGANGWRRLGEAEGLAGSRVNSLTLFQGQLLVAGRDQLLRLSGELLVPALKTPLPSAAGALAVEQSGAGDALWMVGEDWVGRARGSLQNFTVLGHDLDFGWPTWPTSTELAADRLDGLFVGHNQGLFAFHPGTGATRFRLVSGEDSVQSLRVDREGILWVATRSDLIKLASRRFASWTRADGLFADDVTAILERRDGTLVLGHRGGMTLWSESKISTRPLPTQAPNGRPERVRDLAEDAAGRIYMAVDAAGLLRLDGDKLSRFGEEDGLKGTVTAVAVDRGGQVWVGTDRGAYRAEGKTFVRQGPELRIRRIIAAGDGSVYVAAAEGLYQSGPNWRSWTCGLEEPCRSVFSVLETSHGELLVGTGDGLYTTDKSPASGNASGKMSPIDRPRIEAPVFWLLESAGLIWAGTGDGVFRFDRGQQMTHFTIRHGIAGREIHRGAGIRDSSGRIWIGTDRGATVYDPRFERHELVPPKAALLEVEGGEQRFSLEGEERPAFTAVNNDLTFHFRVLSLIDESRTQIRYRLTGVDQDWRLLPTPLLQEARYYDLPPQTYVFELQAASADDVWGEVLHSTPLTIAVPFFRQPWFFGLLLLVAIGGLFISQSFFAQRRYSRRLEGEVEARVVELRASEDRYRKTFRGIDDGILTSDGENKIVLLNPRAQELTGWQEKDAVGRPVGEVLQLYSERGDEDTPLTPQSVEFRDSLGPAQTAMLLTRDGEKKLVELSAAPISSGTTFGGLVFALRDVTRKRQMEEELARAQRLEAIGILAGGIAHDFNNLLTILLGNLSLLRVTLPLDEGMMANMGDAENALLRARDLTQQLLTFARGGSPMRKTASMADVVRDSASFVLRGSKTRCELELAESLWPVEIDAGQMSQVLNNLLINASQAMPSGGLVRIRGRNTESGPEPLPPGRYVHIEVIDQGVGIAEELMPRIFDPYFSTKDDGRGLGLASSYSIVRRHDGLLTVRSKVGRGTTFSIFLPASRHEKVQSKNQEKRASTFRGSGRALVMDDDAVVVRTASALLEKLGYRVSRAADGREAIDRYSEAMRDQQGFAVVLMDLTVPGGMGGQQAIKRLRDLDPNIKAIVYSGYSNDPVLAHYRDYGFAGRLSKPFRLQDLAAALEEALGQA